MIGVLLFLCCWQPGFQLIVLTLTCWDLKIGWYAICTTEWEMKQEPHDSNISMALSAAIIHHLSRRSCLLSYMHETSILLGEQSVVDYSRDIEAKNKNWQDNVLFGGKYLGVCLTYSFFLPFSFFFFLFVVSRKVDSAQARTFGLMFFWLMAMEGVLRLLEGFQANFKKDASIMIML